MTNENQSPVITNIIPEVLQKEKPTKKINIKPKDVVASGLGIGAGVVAYEAGKNIFPILVEKTVEIVTKVLSK